MFLKTLSPMLTLFLCIVIGFVIKKLKVVPDDAAKVMSKLVAWVFYPALCFSSMARFFTVQKLSEHLPNIIIATTALTIAIGIAIPLSCLFIKKKSPERGVYQYALAFANSGYVGDPLVDAMFPYPAGMALSYYKVVCFPISIAIYTWGVSVLVPNGEKKGNVFKKLLNGPLVAMFLGMIVGLICGAIADETATLTAYDQLMPGFMVKTLDDLKACMGPAAMLVAGMTIAKYDFFALFKDKKVYVATALRLTLLPAVIIGATFGLKTLFNYVFGTDINNDAIILLFFALAAPLGLNTVVFPEAYGGNPKTGASMAMISHTLCVISIPLMYILMTSLFGELSFIKMA